MQTSQTLVYERDAFVRRAQEQLIIIALQVTVEVGKLIGRQVRLVRSFVLFVHDGFQTAEQCFQAIGARLVWLEKIAPVLVCFPIFDGGFVWIGWGRWVGGWRRRSLWALGCGGARHGGCPMPVLESRVGVVLESFAPRVSQSRLWSRREGKKSCDTLRPPSAPCTYCPALTTPSRSISHRPLGLIYRRCSLASDARYHSSSFALPFTPLQSSFTRFAQDNVAIVNILRDKVEKYV
jgi:hypothetical protein